MEPTIHQLFDLTGRTALITGGTGYLGSSMSRALAEAGATVVVAGRDRSRCREAVDRLQDSSGGTHHAVQLDHLNPDSVASGFEEALAAAGNIDILINNGNQAVGVDWSQVDAEQFQQCLGNATGYFLLGRHFRDHIVSRGTTGSIIMLGSMYGVVASYPDAYEGVCPASPVAYHALKGGIVHMTRHLAAYWATDGIRVNCLSPGPFPNERAPQAMVERLCTKLPMKRMGLPHELKGAMLLLASDAGSYITGQNLLVDGGWTAW